MAMPTARSPPTTSHSLVWADIPPPPPDDGAAVVTDELGFSCCGAVVDGGRVVDVVGGSVVVVVFGVVVVVDFGLVVVVVGFLVVVVLGLVVVVDACVVVVDSVVGGGSVVGVCAELGTIQATSRAVTTTAAATPIDLRRIDRC
jgi:hypothetical protein